MVKRAGAESESLDLEPGSVTDQLSGPGHTASPVSSSTQGEELDFRKVNALV